MSLSLNEFREKELWNDGYFTGLSESRETIERLRSKLREIATFEISLKEFIGDLLDDDDETLE